MIYASRADLAQAFCSYCGYPPMGPWRTLAHRVCMRCESGMVMRAPPALQPRFDDPFVIVDDRLRLQAISHRAEVVLMADKPAALDAPLEDLFVPSNGDRDEILLARLVERAVAGSTSATTIGLRRIGDPESDFLARVSGCGPPPAALLILTSLTAAPRRAINGDADAGGRERLDPLPTHFSQIPNSEVALYDQPGAGGQALPVIARWAPGGASTRRSRDHVTGG